MKPDNVIGEDDEFWYVAPRGKDHPECVELLRSIKRWERSFFEKNGHKPSKFDIFAAPDEVEAMYARYWDMVKGRIKKKKSSSHRAKADASNPDKSEDKSLDHPRDKPDGLDSTSATTVEKDINSINIPKAGSADLHSKDRKSKSEASSKEKDVKKSSSSASNLNSGDINPPRILPDAWSKKLNKDEIAKAQRAKENAIRYSKSGTSRWFSSRLKIKDYDSSEEGLENHSLSDNEKPKKIKRRKPIFKPEPSSLARSSLDGDESSQVPDSFSEPVHTEAKCHSSSSLLDHFSSTSSLVSRVESSVDADTLIKDVQSHFTLLGHLDVVTGTYKPNQEERDRKLMELVRKADEEERLRQESYAAKKDPPEEENDETEATEQSKISYPKRRFYKPKNPPKSKKKPEKNITSSDTGGAKPSRGQKRKCDKENNEIAEENPPKRRSTRLSVSSDEPDKSIEPNEISSDDEGEEPKAASPEPSTSSKTTNRRRRKQKENFVRLDIKRKHFAPKGKKFNYQKYKRNRWKFLRSQKWREGQYDSVEGGQRGELDGNDRIPGQEDDMDCSNKIDEEALPAWQEEEPATKPKRRKTTKVKESKGTIAEKRASPDEGAPAPRRSTRKRSQTTEQQVEESQSTDNANDEQSKDCLKEQNPAPTTPIKCPTTSRPYNFRTPLKSPLKTPMKSPFTTPLKSPKSILSSSPRLFGTPGKRGTPRKGLLFETPKKVTFNMPDDDAYLCATMTPVRPTRLSSAHILAPETPCKDGDVD